MYVSTPQACAVHAHVYKTYIHQRPRPHYQAKDKHDPADGSLPTEVSLCMHICVSVCEEVSCWERVSARFILHTKTRAELLLAEVLRAFSAGRSSSALFQGNGRLMGTRWGLHTFPPTRSGMIDSELWLPRIRATVETWQLKSASCFSWPQKERALAST